MTNAGTAPAPFIDTSQVSAARLYDYLLGGKDNYEIDRQAAERLLEVAPYMRDLAQANRGFLRRAIDMMVGERGVRQLIDIGAGIPTSPSVHELARTLDDGVRVAYLDNDAVALAHNRALLSTASGTMTLAHDVRDPEAILADAELHRLIEIDRPVGLLFIAVLHFVGIDEAPALVARLRDAVPVGSCLAISAVSRDGSDPTTVAVAESMYQNSSASLYVRDHAEVEALFEGFELTEPLADITQWRNPSGTTLPLRALCGVGVKI
ncbi:MAG: SAM-dependent methyltransferase [Kineosporiaceae bacterium]|nr:SAM-dependent methyltransferase [Kineosporiaceae bacterium]